MPTISLSWPPAPLLSNARGHTKLKARYVAGYRNEAFWTAKQEKVQRMPDAVLRVSFYPPDRRRRDLHNMPSAIKAAIDGIALAMGCDDNGFRVHWPTEFGPVVEGGKVVIMIGEK